MGCMILVREADMLLIERNDFSDRESNNIMSGEFSNSRCFRNMAYRL